MIRIAQAPDRSYDESLDPAQNAFQHQR